MGTRLGDCGHRSNLRCGTADGPSEDLGLVRLFPNVMNQVDPRERNSGGPAPSQFIPDNLIFID
jgi:hypothetical protein